MEILILICKNVSYGIKEYLMALLLMILTNFLASFTLSFWDPLLMSELHISLSCNMTKQVLERAPYEVAYRLFVSLVSSCCNEKWHWHVVWGLHNVLPLNMLLLLCLFPSVLSGFVMKLFIVLLHQDTLLSPDLFLNYGHLVEYILFFQNATSTLLAHLFSW